MKSKLFLTALAVMLMTMPLWAQNSPQLLPQQTASTLSSQKAPQKGGKAKETPCMTLTTTKAIGESIWLKVNGTAILQYCWIDLNHNGSYDGTEEDLYEDNQTHNYTIGSQTIDIYNSSGAGTITELDCEYNNISSLDISKNADLKHLWCSHNAITNLDIISNTNLSWLYCGNNALTSLDIRQNTAIVSLACNDNNLRYLNMANGKNSSFPSSGSYAVTAKNNPDLYCIKVDEGFVPPSTGSAAWLKDDQASWNFYTTPCSPSPAEPYVELTVQNNSTLKVDMKATHASTPIWLLYEGGFIFQLVDADTWNGYQTFDIQGSNVTIHGDLLSLEAGIDNSNEDNHITAIDASHATTCKSFVVEHNDMDACALDAFFNSLPVNGNSLHFSDNPGATTSNTQIAVNKGYTVDVTGDGSGCAPTPPAGTPYVSLTVQPNSPTKLDFKGTAANTRVWVETSPGTYQAKNIGDAWCGYETYAISGSSVKVYGNLVSIDMGLDGNNENNHVIAIDASHTAVCKGYYVEHNEMDACALNAFFNSLPANGNYLHFSSNPGATTSNTQIAVNKGYTVDVTGDGTGCMPTPPAGTPYVSLTVQPNSPTELDFYGAAANTPVWVETSPGTYQAKYIDDDWCDYETYAISGSSVKVYGNIKHIDMGLDGNNEDNHITAIDVSHNTIIQDIYAEHNDMDACALNAFFNSLPANGGSLYFSSNPGAATSNTQIAVDKGYTVDVTGDGSGCSPQFSISPANHNYGDVTIGQSVTQSFTVSNTGDQSLQLSSFSLSGANAAYFSHTASATTVAAGDTYTFAVSYTPAAAGGHAATLTVVDNISKSSHAVGLSGTGVSAPTPSFSIAPASHNYGTVLVGNSQSKTFQITNSGTAALQLNSFVLGGSGSASYSHTASNNTTVAAGGSYTFELTFSPSSAGPKAATLTITDNSSVGTHSVALSGEGEVATFPAFSISPSSHNYGDVTIGQTASQTFVVSNTGTAPLQLSSFSLGGANASNFSHTATNNTTVAVGGTYAFSVEFTPSGSGNKSATLTIIDNVSKSSHAISLSGKGVTAPTPNFSITPIAHNFGKVIKGAVANKYFTVSNTGAVPLQLTGFSMIGAQAASFTHSGTPTTVAAGGTYSFVVTFSPTALGNKSATLRITDNSSAGTHDVALQGQCIAGAGTPGFSVTPSSCNYGDVTVGQTAVQTVVISNPGSAPLQLQGFTLSGADAASFSHTAVNNTTVAPGDSYSFAIKFTPSSIGNKAASLRIADNAGSLVAHRISLSGKGVNTALPSFSITPLSHNYGKVVKGTSVSQSFVITNAGTVPLQISNMEMTGVDASVFVHTGNMTSIAAGGSYSFVVAFKPSSFGSKAAVLRISDNTSAGTHLVSLQGECVSGVGVQELEASQIAIYPNPAHSFITIEFSQGYLGSEVELFDLMGRSVLRKVLQSYVTHIDISHLPAGVYIIQTAAGTKKLIVK